MSENISSHNQSGGITAHTVNIGGAPLSPPPEKPKPIWKKAVACIVASVAFVASVVKVLDYFNVNPKPEAKSEMKLEPRREGFPTMNPPQSVNVTSYNQSGGITAHTVNIGDSQRGIPQSLGPDIQRILGATAKLDTEIEYHPSDPQAYRLASSIGGACEVAGIKPLMVAGMRPYEAGIIISCNNDLAEGQANAFKQVLVMARMSAEVRRLNGNENKVFISVGPVH